ncbi:MAG: DUF2970 domain-containing protein [Burkholderiales bacterium]|nr:DUF2970 domain-containing protein [Burkholderiales bacterium]
MSPTFKTSAQAVRAVFCAFTGIGKRQDLEQHMSALRPHHVIIAGLLCAAGFVIGVVTLVKAVAN